MDRRETLKSLLVGGVGSGLLLSGCQPISEEKIPEQSVVPDYGRTEEEKAHDAQLMQEQFFNEHELVTIAILCDLILPASPTAGSATDAGVPEFIDFIVKDITSHQVPLRGGLMWLDNRSDKLFDHDFNTCNESQQKQILDEIAYPDVANAEVSQGVQFFSRMRNLVLTGYYTTRMGFDDLGYKGNIPNVWDGIPQEILDKHGLSYDPVWLAKCVDQEKRTDVAKWDDDGNLIS